MYKRKYVRYTLVADFGQVNEEYEKYREAYSDYCKQVRYGSPATLYGISEEGGISVIKSKG